MDFKKFSTELKLYVQLNKQFIKNEDDERDCLEDLYKNFKEMKHETVKEFSLFYFEGFTTNDSFFLHSKIDGLKKIIGKHKPWSP
jgi:hypothetical protein